MTCATKLIHVRFFPDGTVSEIGERPPSMTPQGWFDTLSLQAGDKYQTLAGGRGIFHVTPEALEAVQAEAVK